MTASVADFLKRAADRNGFSRDRYDERRIPTDFSNVCILPFFGDLRSAGLLSSFLLHRYRAEVKGSKYFILASWPGFQGLFPYVDEYWSFTDGSILKRFYEGAHGLRNKSDLGTVYQRNLNEFFRDVLDIADFEKMYKNGFTNYFFDKYGDTKLYLPFVPSASVLGKDFNRELATRPGYKVFLAPSVHGRFFSNGQTELVKAKREYYIELVNFLVGRNITPVLWQNFLTYDLSEAVGDRVILFNESDIIRALSAMRSTGYVLDICNGLSRLALLARTPFLALDERSRFNATKEYEVDGLCGVNIPKQYIFTFSTILTEGTLSNWKSDSFPAIANRLEAVLPELNREAWPSTAEQNEIVPYKKLVQVHKPKKFGTRFIKVEHD